MKKFSSIEQFRNVAKRIRETAEHHGVPRPTMGFTGTVKLHGSNAGIRREMTPEGPIYLAQSRNRMLTVEEDNYGWAKWVEGIPSSALAELFILHFGSCRCLDSQPLTLYGEIIGPGVQKGVGISELPSKQFVIFQGAVGDDYWQTENEGLEEYGIYSILRVPQYHVEVDFAVPEEAMAEIERLTLEVEERCPWASSFGIEGVGEGIVWTCDNDPCNSDYWFKTKGQKHSVSKVKKVVSVDPEKVASLRELVVSVVTENRLEQLLEKMKADGQEISRKNTGAFIGMAMSEIHREEADTVEASGVEWKEFCGAAVPVVRDYWFKHS